MSFPGNEMAANQSDERSDFSIPADAELEQVTGGGMVEAEMAGKAVSNLAQATTGFDANGHLEAGLRSDRYRDKKLQEYGGTFGGWCRAMWDCAKATDDEKKSYLGES